MRPLAPFGIFGTARDCELYGAVQPVVLMHSSRRGGAPSMLPEWCTAQPGSRFRQLAASAMENVKRPSDQAEEFCLWKKGWNDDLMMLNDDDLVNPCESL